MSTAVNAKDFVAGETYTIGKVGKPGFVSFTVVSIAPAEPSQYDLYRTAVTCTDGTVRTWSSNWAVFRPASSALGAKDVEFRGTGQCSCTERVTVIVPAAFFEDHARRDCLAHAVRGVQLSKGIRVELCPVDIAELLSDARHYVDGGTQTYGAEMIGLISSARATVKRLAKLAQ
jgi:hypothetical protein